MLSVNNITIRFGPRVLFKNVTCTFMAGRRLRRHRSDGCGQVHVYEILTGEIDSTADRYPAGKRWAFLRQDQFAFDEYRVIDTVIMGMSLCGSLEEPLHSMRNRTTN